MRRYGLDVTLLLGRRTGIGRLVEALVERIPPLLADDERLVLCARTFRLNPLLGVSHEALRRAGRHPRVEVRRVYLPTSVLERVGRRAPRLEIDVLAGPLDVIHGTAAALPASRRARGVVTIHDLGPLRRPADVAPHFARRFRDRVERAVRRAGRVLADSEFTARETSALLGVDPARVEVVRPGVSPEFSAAGDPDADRGVAARHGLDGPYVLFVGTTNPRKNVVRLVEAFVRARREAQLPHVLALVGERGPDDARVREAAAAAGGAVRVVGWVPEEDLPALYRVCDAFAFVSHYEGFGLPVIEAMAAGRPVLASRAASVPEVAGDAALFVDPESTDDVAGGLVRVLRDAGLRERLAHAGRARAAQFPWEPFVRRHLEVYRELAAAAREG
jgi:glycosyltransferase involved in cell wall biosynthesis